MYVIGNGELLAQNNHVWKQVIDTFQKRDHYGTSLTLACQKHPQTTHNVSKDVDFKAVQDGGCSLPCKESLDCGHPCPRKCHPYSHDQLECVKPCQRISSCGHPCNKR